MSQAQAIRPTFHGRGGTLFGIQFVNGILVMLTLGIYAAWGRTRVRRFLWGQTEFAGDRLTYHGTGGELFKGYILGGLLFGGLYFGFGAAIQYFVVQQNVVALIAFMLLAFVAFVTLVAVAKVGARRYRLSRTSWRGIRFSFRGSVGEFLGIYLVGALLTAITLGIYFPYFAVKQRRFFTDHTRFGNRPFQFAGSGSDLVGRYMLAVLLTVPTLGLGWLWYSAYRDRYYWANTYFEGHPFDATVSGSDLLALVLTNLLLLVVTFGLAMPWVVVRIRRFVCDRILIPGDIDLRAVVQDAREAMATGEGVSEVLDMGGLDIGAGF